ncbi:MAG: transporter substrate-binding domain-containing protein, partial [Rhodoferax sp.]|nr:transporter substrate-binding domain-containing protein [Rhodoferax sp.]
MSSLLKNLTCAALTVLFIGTPVHAQALKAGSTPTGVPFTFLDTKTNSIQGVIVDLTQAIAKDQKLIIEIQGMPFSALIPSLTSSKIDIIA